MGRSISVVVPFPPEVFWPKKVLLVRTLYRSSSRRLWTLFGTPAQRPTKRGELRCAVIRMRCSGVDVAAQHDGRLIVAHAVVVPSP